MAVITRDFAFATSQQIIDRGSPVLTRRNSSIQLWIAPLEMRFQLQVDNIFTDAALNFKSCI